MKIAVIAASGRTGRVAVQVMLAAGHQVRAGIYPNTKTKMESIPNLTLIDCDATKEAEVTRLIQGQDAVVSFIGHVPGSHPDVQTNATQTIISVMKKLGQKRFISLTGTGVRFPNDTITPIDRVINTAVTILDPHRINDGINHAELIKKSGLDWTILRVLILTNGKPRKFFLVANGPAKTFISRTDVAKAAIQVLEQSAFIKMAPIIAPVKQIP